MAKTHCVGKEITSMAIQIKYKGNIYNTIIGGSRNARNAVSLNMSDSETAQNFANASFSIFESDEVISYMGKTIRVEMSEEYGVIYPIITELGETPYFQYDKATGTITNIDKGNIEKVCNFESFGEWLAKVVYHQNKYMFNVYCNQMETGGWYGYGLNTQTVFNTLTFINDGVFGQLENMIKNLGIEFFNKNISREDFTLNNAKKLHRVIELPKQVLEFLKDKEFASLLSDFKLIAADNPNEAIYVVEWYQRYKKMQNLKKGTQYFDSFIRELAKLKEKYKIDIFKLLPYLAAQRFYFEEIPEDKFELPYEELRLYRDYMNLGNVVDKFPSCLQAAHNIGVRNNKIVSNTELCAKFAEVVAPWKEWEWVHDGFAIVAPVTAQDFVSEGENLHHCLATYVELVANGSEKVMFVRNEATPNESLITFAFDDDFKAVEIKEAFNVDVEDPKVIALLQDWRIKQKERIKKAAEKAAASV